MGILWTIFGISLTILVFALKEWNQKREQTLKWWQWLLTAVWGIAVLATIAFIGTAFGEGEPRAAVTGGVFFGLIVAVSGVGLWRWIFTNKSAREKAQDLNA